MPAPSLNLGTRKLLLTIANTQPDDRKVYTGTTAAGAVLVTNVDGSASKVRSARTAEIPLAAIQTVSGQVFRVTVVRDEAPDASAQWWLSKDGGATKVRVKKISIETRDGFHVVLLEES